MNKTMKMLSKTNQSPYTSQERNTNPNTSTNELPLSLHQPSSISESQYFFVENWTKQWGTLQARSLRGTPCFKPLPNKIPLTPVNIFVAYNTKQNCYVMTLSDRGIKRLKHNYGYAGIYNYTTWVIYLNIKWGPFSIQLVKLGRGHDNPIL